MLYVFDDCQILLIQVLAVLLPQYEMDSHSLAVKKKVKEQRRRNSLVYRSCVQQKVSYFLGFDFQIRG